MRGTLHPPARAGGLRAARVVYKHRPEGQVRAGSETCEKEIKRPLAEEPGHAKVSGREDRGRVKP